MGASLFEGEDPLRRIRLLPQKFPASAAMMFEEKLTGEEFQTWLVQSRPGDYCVYFVGGYLPANKPEAAEIAWSAYTQHQVYLVQKKDDTLFNYIAIRAYNRRA